MHSPNGRPASFSIASVMLCSGNAGTAGAGTTLPVPDDGDALPAAWWAAKIRAVLSDVVECVGLAVSRG